jgi:uncharacterized protein (DUF58 family)
LDLSPQALRQLNRLRLNTHLLLPGLAVGARASQQRKPAAEFREHRRYTPGDDVRYVDWKASARQEHIFIKQGEHQKDALIYLLLDCSASMAWGDPPKSFSALALAAALGYLALAQNDRLAVLPLVEDPPGGQNRPPLGPILGKGQVPLFINYLQSLHFKGQVNLARSVAGLVRREGARSGMVILLSDLLGVDDLARALEPLPLPAWNVVVCHLLHPAEIDPTLRGDLEMQDIETGQKKRYSVTSRALDTYRQRLQAWRSDVAGACLERKAVYTMIPTHWSIEKEILPHLRKARIVAPVLAPPNLAPPAVVQPGPPPSKARPK